MSDPRYECPDCSATVWHMCHPPQYFRGRRLPRLVKLPRLRHVDPEEIREADRERHANTSPVVAALQAELGEAAFLPIEEEP